jgi:hypothetical protein
MLSHDYVSRSMEFLYPKNQMTDDLCTTITRTNGPFQIFMNFSRYNQLSSSLNDLSVCKSLLYLDISYTKVLDLQFLAGFAHLKGLNLAGIEVSHESSYDVLQNLNHIEILVLRASNISSGTRLRGLIFLRSLDIGNTKISSIDFIKDFHRLEELLVDSCPIINQRETIVDCIEALKSLPSLKLLNICDTILISKVNLLINSNNTCIEKYTMSASFFDAVIMNDVKRTEDLLIQVLVMMMFTYIKITTRGCHKIYTLHASVRTS